jgi:hypothetical protein
VIDSTRHSDSRTVLTRLLAQLAVLGLLVFGATLLTGTSASAQGTSSRVYNCYTQWWNTAWAQRCAQPGAAWAGGYESTVSCSLQGTRSLSVRRSQGSVADFPGADCTFSVSNGQIRYYL